MKFKKKELEGTIMGVLDIGSYKLRLCIAEFYNEKIRILGYREKRQNTSYFFNQECHNFPGLADNISELIGQLEKKIGIKIPALICNYPFGELHLTSSTTNHIRKNPSTQLTQKELVEIFFEAEKICLTKQGQEIEKLYGLKNSDIDIILSRVTQIQINNQTIEKISKLTGENVTIQLINLSIPQRQKQKLVDLCSYIDTHLLKILPCEYTHTKLTTQENVVHINIGATQTSVSVKYQGGVIGITKLPIGTHHLIAQIAKNHTLTRVEIIKDLNTKKFQLEKKYFGEIWGQAFGISLAEILKKRVCPRYFCISGGGNKNTFLHEIIHSFPFQTYAIHIPEKHEIISEDIANILQKMEHIEVQDIDRMNMDMYALLEEAHKVINFEGDTFSRSLQLAMKQLGYDG